MKDDLPKFSFGKMTSSLNALKSTKIIKIFFYLTVSGFDALKSKTCCQKLPKNLRGRKKFVLLHEIAKLRPARAGSNCNVW